MDDKTREEIASFRYGLISQIVSREDLRPGETMALIREAAARRYVIPGSIRTEVGERTIQRYLSLYRKGGLDALKPKEREYACRISKEAVDLAIALRRENPKRAITTIIDMLESSGQIEPGYLKRTTLYEHFKKAGLTRLEQARAGIYRRYCRQSRNSPGGASNNSPTPRS